MKQTILMLLFFLPIIFTLGQNNNTPAAYYDLVKQAYLFYHAKEYRKAAEKFAEAFKTNKFNAALTDRYNAACSWAGAGVPDSAFFHLYKMAKSNYTHYRHIATDADLAALHGDKRWSQLLELVKQNKERVEAHLNKSLTAILDTIYLEDQKYRMQIDTIEKKYGWNAKELKHHWAIINQKDSINLIKVKAILDNYGWLGQDVVGEQGSVTLFLVIQHSDLATQEKYLPMLREAVKKGKAQGSDLALLEDRVALRKGKKQIYGSQIGRDPTTHQYFVSPLEDPDNVDKRRATVGLPPMAAYVSLWQIDWNVDQYKKDLPALEAKTKLK